jgi:hypothetical protein
MKSRRLATVVLAVSGILGATPAEAHLTTFSSLTPGSIVAIGSLISADDPPGSGAGAWQIVDLTGMGSAAAPGTAQAGGSSPELFLAGGAQLDFREIGFVSGSFLFRQTPLLLQGPNQVEINNAFGDLPSLIAAGSGTLGGFGYEITTFPDGHSRFAFTGISLPPPLFFGQSFSIVGRSGIAVDNVLINYLPEPSAAGLAVSAAAAIAVRRRIFRR